MTLRGLATLGALLACGTHSVLAADAGGAPIQFQRDIRPLLSNHCYQCHGPDQETREADLRLDTREGLFGETASGSPAIAPGKPADSEVLRRITAEHADERMPPAAANKPLSDGQIDLLRRWVEQGADYHEHWSYAAPVRAEPPAAGTGESPHPVDRFIRARLASEGLEPAPPADPVTLARRLALDLTGLPPPPATVARYAADPSAANYAALVDELLASPHFGERLAIYWLDLVRYADSCGYHSDVERPIWPYRDYVINAFSSNLPFDQFTREQLAGDLLPDPTLAQRIASGYNRLNKTTEEGGAQEGEYLAKSAADRVRTTAGVWLAATLGCAECHDHKFDPYTTRDFYSFAAFFADVQDQGVYKAANHDPVVLLPSAEQSARLAELTARRQELDSQLATLDAADAETRKSLESELKDLKKEQTQFEASIPRSMVSVSVPPRETRILPRGNWLDASGELVEPRLPGFLPAAAGDSAPAAETARLTRLDLANWLTAPEHPLTARVFVNRLWKLYFGAGLAKNLDDFGAQGELPSHPELLDWLAVEFRESGWNVKQIVRLLVTSATYQQASVPTPEQLRRDPQNRLLARQARWRLDAEMVRDQALAASGLLVRTIGGPSVKPYQPEGYWEFLNFPKRTWKPDSGDAQHRRGLYTHWQRTFLHPSLLAFDAPSREECTAERAPSNTPKSALALLNDPSFVECARALAARLLREAPGDDRSRIAWAWRECTSRDPHDDELGVLGELLAHNRERYAADADAATSLAQVGETRWPDDLPAPELAAWTAVARAILNVHECVARN
ncbi:MAG: PSD1 domain-containing protein [Planctomycetaceae bacterium]|nr:PSD1 domain-containing protein [Planctomycetaceae bacterium]